MAERLNASPEDFHNNIKPDIINDAYADDKTRAALKKIGSPENPDIGVNTKDGTIYLKNVDPSSRFYNKAAPTNLLFKNYRLQW